MFEGDDPEFIRSIVEMFIANTPGSIANIKEAFDADEMERLRQVAHKLKPHYTFFGVLHLQTALQMIEDIAKSGEGKESLPDLITLVEKNTAPMIEQMKADFP